MTPVECGGVIDQEMLDPNDVFILDLEKVVYIWVGDSKSSKSVFSLSLKAFHKISFES